jgi:hypothetical protein
VLPTDALVAGLHFFADDPPGTIARKALRVNLSDLAAKGAGRSDFCLRPRATFAEKLSRARTRAGGLAPPLVETRPPVRSPARALRALNMGGPVLVIGPNAALRVRGGALDVEQGFSPDRVRVGIDVDQPKPAAILFDAHGEFLTGEAILAKYRREIGDSFDQRLHGLLGGQEEICCTAIRRPQRRRKERIARA